MRIRRRRLRTWLVVVGCLVGVPIGERSPAAIAVAAVLLVAGSALHLWSKGCLEQNRRLVTAGPYRFTRNPFYLANGLIDAGLCVLIGLWWVALPYAVFWLLAYRETIRREEDRLAALFPAEYPAYVARVPRLLPTGRMLAREATRGAFSLSNPALARGGEYPRLIGFALSLAAIIACSWLRTTGLAVFTAEHSGGLGLVAFLPIVWGAKLALERGLRRRRACPVPNDSRSVREEDPFREEAPDPPG